MFQRLNFQVCFHNNFAFSNIIIVKLRNLYFTLAVLFQQQVFSFRDVFFSLNKVYTAGRVINLKGYFDSRALGK